MKTSIALLLFSFPFFFQAQTQGIAYPAIGKGVATTYVTDYHCLGINTSALGWGTGFNEKNWTLGTSEFGFGIYSDALNKTRLNNFYQSFKGAIMNNGDTLNWAQKRDAAADFAEKGVNMFVNLNWFGISYQNEKLGGIAFNIRESYQWYSKLNQETTDIIFRGKLANYFDSLTVVYGSDTSRIANSENISQDTLDHVILGSISSPLNLSTITKGSTIKSVWNRYYSFGYGRKILGKDSIFEIYGGIGGRYIQSMAMFNMESTDEGLYMYSSITPSFNIDYGSIAMTNPSAFTAGGNFPKAVGSGFGVDLSASAILFEKLKLAVAVNNIGQVTYKRNVYKVSDTLLTDVSVSGLNDYNLTLAVNQMLKEGGILKLQGQDSYTLKNAADLRIGGSLEVTKYASIGFDVVTPFDSGNPGSLVNPVYSIGGHIKPLKWLTLSAGYFGGGIYRNNIPVGINFTLRDGAYEFGVSSYDAISFFSDNSNSISAAFGFARVRF